MRYRRSVQSAIDLLRQYGSIVHLSDTNRPINKPSVDSKRNTDAEKLYKSKFTKSTVKYDDGLYIRHSTNFCL